MGKKWNYSVSRNGRHQIREEGRSQVCALWNCKDTQENAKLITMAPDMQEYLIELRERFYRAGFASEASRIDIILSNGE